MEIELSLLPKTAVWLIIGVVLGIPFLISGVFPFLLPAGRYALGTNLPGPRIPGRRINTQWSQRTAKERCREGRAREQWGNEAYASMLPLLVRFFIRPIPNDSDELHRGQPRYYAGSGT